jgi:hypothetical protein
VIGSSLVENLSWGLSMTDEGRVDYKVPGKKTAKLALFWSSDFFGVHDQDVIGTARKVLGEHDLSLAWISTTRNLPNGER